MKILNIDLIENKLNEYDEFIFESKEKLLLAIIAYCKEEKGNMKKLSESLGMHYTFLSQVLHGHKKQSLEKLISIYKKTID